MFPFLDPHPPAPSLTPSATGRPRALTETKLSEICALISAGCCITDAARYVGCAASTIRRESRRNSEFHERLRRASLNAELAPLGAMREAARRHWRAAAWLLERMNAQRFGKQNIRCLKPDQLDNFASALFELIRPEFKDDHTRKRISSKFNKLVEHVDAELAALRDPFPRPKKQRRGRSSAFSPEIHIEPRPENDSQN